MSEVATAAEKRQQTIDALLRERATLEKNMALNESLGEDNRGLGTVEEIDAELRRLGHKSKGAK